MTSASEKGGGSSVSRYGAMSASIRIAVVASDAMLSEPVLRTCQSGYLRHVMGQLTCAMMMLLLLSERTVALK